MTKTILLLTTPFRPNTGGVETHLDDLIQEGTKHGFKFLVVTYQPLVTNEKGRTIEKGAGFVIYRIPWIRMGLFLRLERYPILEFFYLFPALFLFGLLFLFRKNSQVNVIHAQGLVAGAVGVFLARIFKKPVILSTHSIYNFPTKGLYPEFVRFIFKECRKILALSEQSKHEIIRLGINRKKVDRFTYWVDQKTFSPSSKLISRRNLSLFEDKFICLFVGRLIRVKGIKELLQAAKNTPQVDFLIIGDGPMEQKVKTAATKFKNIFFIGKVDNSKLPLYYNAADVLIVPSVHDEGFGRVILEALSCGLPVIASRRGGIPEAISSEVGIFIDVTPKNISRAIRDLLERKRQLLNLSMKARNYAKVRFSKKNANMIFQYYG